MATAMTSPTLKSFFGFKRHPFPPSCPPDPLFLTPAIVVALNAVQSAIQHRLHSLVTAPPGSGKSSFARLLDAELNPRDFRIVPMMGQTLSVTEVLNRISDALHLDTGWRRGKAVHALTEGLRNLDASHGPFPVLRIDEAQYLPLPALDLLRTIIEDAPRPLLSMVLLGDQTLQGKLNRPTTAALLGRMAARVQLDPFSEDETADFVEHTFRAVGMENILSPTSTAPLYAGSGGLPRKISEILHRAMQTAVHQRSRMLTDEIVQEAIDAART